MQIGTTRGRIAAGVALVAVVALAAGAGLAAQGRGDRGVFGGTLRSLDLSDEQRESVRGAVREHRDGGAAARQALRAAQRKLREAVTAEVVDEAAIRAAAAEAAALRADAAVRRAELHADILALLTSDQRAEWMQLRENAREHRQERRGRRGRGER